MARDSIEMARDPVEILLVEDNRDHVELALRALKKGNLSSRIQVVRDGAEALDFLFCTGAYTQRALEDVPRVILLDLKLPKITGLEVLRRVKSTPRTCTIPVVVFTSSQNERDIVESYQLNVNSYIIKPMDFEKFTATMQHVGLYWALLNQCPPL